MHNAALSQKSHPILLSFVACCMACGSSDSGAASGVGGSTAGGGAHTGGASGVVVGGSSSAESSASQTGGSSSTKSSAATGGALVTGGTTGALGGHSATGGKSADGGASATGGKAAGGMSATGGSSATGGTVADHTSATGGKSAATGGSTATGGTSSATGGTLATGGGSSSAGGRGSGICPGGSYPAPTLPASATLVSSSSDRGQYEGALWVESLGVLLFSGMDTDASGIVPATVGKLTPPSTVETSFIADSGTNGLAIDFKGTVLSGSQKVQGIVTVDLSAKSVTTLVNTDASGHHFNSVNDLTVRTDGTIYFTDPDYQLGGRTNETGIKGVYRYSPSKVVSVVDDKFNQPNGITLSPDESTLYVSDTAANKIRKFAVAADGSTSGKTDFATMTSPDGGAIDCAGNLYWASNSSPGKVVVISPAGTQIGTIALGSSDKATNVAFGGPDHKTLYVTTSPRKLYSAPLNIPGFPY